MIKPEKCIFSKISILIIGIFLILNFNSFSVSAAQVSFAISPSKIYDQQINLGESKKFVFNVANKSVGVTDDSLKNMKISMESHLENEYGESISNNIVTFDNENLTVKPDEVQKVTATVKIPNDMIQGNYKLSIDFVQAPMEGLFGEQTNVISVPIFVFVGTSDEYSKMKVDYSVGDSYISYNTENTTLFKETFKNCIKVLNPLNTLSTIKNIVYKPTYNFVKNKTDRIDINNDIYTNLENVMTLHKKTSNFKYVYYKKDWLNKKVVHSSKSANKIILTLEDDITIEIKGIDDSLKEINTQLLNIAKENKDEDITLNDLAKELIVPKNCTYAKLTPYLITKVTSNSDIPITLTGNYKTTQNNSKVILEGEILSQTIAPNTTEEIKNIISKEDLTKGTYTINGNFVIRDLSKDFSHKFSVTSLRYIMLVIVIVFILVYYYIIYKIIKWLLERKVPELYIIIDKKKFKAFILSYVWNNTTMAEYISDIDTLLAPINSEIAIKFNKKPTEVKILLNNEELNLEDNIIKNKQLIIKTSSELNESTYKVIVVYSKKEHVEYLFKIKTYNITDNE